MPTAYPLFFVDPVRKVVATSHAGWKGTAARIGRITVDRMARGLRLPSGGYLSRNRAVHRGPAVSKWTNLWLPYSPPWGKAPGCIRERGAGKYDVDLWEVNRRVLAGAGIEPEHISVAGLCTRCHPDIFWSHRAAGALRGSLAAFIAIADR